MAIKSDGTLWAWGSNARGQLGDGSFTDENVPTQVGSATNWSKIAARANSSAAINNSGELFIWGDDFNGQLGVSTSVYRNI